MALKPNDGETFLKEVDDELRKEQVTNFFTRYGWWVITAVVLILGGVGGWIWWSGRQAAARESAGETLLAAMSQVEAGNQSAVAAQPQLNALAGNDIEGYRARGRDEAEAAKVVADARAVAEAGAFCIVIEGVMEEIAAEATKAVACPTIGIGASAACDGQILVTEDMMGLFERTPRFVKRFGDIASEISAAAAGYAAEVKSRAFPTEEQIYRGKK